MLKRYLATVFLLVTIFAFGAVASAAPYEGEIFQLKQPDNSSVSVKVWGDEFYQRVESLDGYALVLDPKTNWICYAKLNEDGSDFISTGVVYKGSNTTSVRTRSGESIEKGLKIKKEHILKKAEIKKQDYFAATDGKDLTYEGTNTQPQTRATIGNIKGLTILIDFSDVPATIPKADLDNMINQPGYAGYSNKGSVRDYFYDVSEGKMVYTNTVTEYYRALKPKSYYNDPNASGRARELVVEALTHLKNTGFDFTTLSKNSNGMIMAVNIFYSGNPDVAWSKGLWPHSGSISSFQVNGGYISRYQMTSIGSSLSIGTFIHENGHMVCGYPDLYDYDYDSKGVGGFCVMCSSGGKNPVPPNPYFRSVISGWGSVTNLNSFPNKSQISVNAATLDVYRYAGPTTNEFFMVENIRKLGRWQSMPDEGLIVWHVDSKGSNNYQDMTLARHYKVSVEQADGQFHLEKNVSGHANDLFHLGNADKFNDTTVPNSKWWNGTASGFDISNISAVGDVMTFVLNNGNTTATSTPTPTNTSTPTPTATQKPTNTPTPTATPTQKPTSTPTPYSNSISGFVKPDVQIESANGLAGFKVEIVGTSLSAVTDTKGYYQMKDIPSSSTGYSLIFSKPGYLTRKVTNVPATANVMVGTATKPVDLWAGDVPIGGVQDDAINMSDIVELLMSYNTASGDSLFKPVYDFNLDNAVNMTDIIVLVNHFNQGSADYPAAAIAVPTGEPTSTPIPTPVPTNTPTPKPTSTPTGNTYPAWDSNSHAYQLGDRVSYQGNNYECIFAHTSNPGWNPVEAFTLWKKI